MRNLIEITNEHFQQQVICPGDFVKEITNQRQFKNYDNVVCIADSYFQTQTQFTNRSDVFDSILYLESNPKRKTFEAAQEIISHLLTMNASRKTALVGLGGGYIGDVVGFVCSVFMRGIDFIQIPTTSMSMCDAVMGKVAIDYGNKKNILGNFYSPCLTIIDEEFLISSPINLFISSFSEMWKHAMVSNGAEYESQIFTELERWYSTGDISVSELIDIFHKSLKIKAEFVSRDIFDTKGTHKALSLGHTFANYFEQGGAMAHGVAVMHGLLLANILSYKLHKISEQRYEDILEKWKKVHSVSPETFYMKPNLLDIDSAIKHYKADKIDAADKLSFVLLDTNKGFVIERALDEDLVRNVFENYIKMIEKL